MGSVGEYNNFKGSFTPVESGAIPDQLSSPFQKKEGLAVICRAMGIPFSEVKDAITPDNPAMGMAGMGMFDMSAMGGMTGAGMGMPGMGQAPAGVVMGGPDLSGFNLEGIGMPGMGMASAGGSINAKPTILVVDDNAMTLRSMKGLLEDDYNVMVANSGSKAFKMMERGVPNLILLDYEMPEMDGRQVMQTIKSNPMFFNIPVIFLTGVNDREHISAALALRPAGYLLKPVAKAKLLATIESTLGTASGKNMNSGDTDEVPFF